MVSIFDVQPEKLAKELAKILKEKGIIKAPVWAQFVKTGAHKERPPVNKDWFYIRAASVLRTIEKDGPVGVSKLRSRYGGRKSRGLKPHAFRKGSGSIIRKVLQQLEAGGLVVQQKTGVHKGRIIAPAGKKILVQAAKSAK